MFIDLQPHEIQFLRNCLIEKRKDFEFIETGRMPIWYDVLIEKLPDQHNVVDK
jgi:hypothetical protein